MAAHISYRLLGAGWAECEVAIGTAKATVTASYLGDALGELIAATRDAMNGAEYSTAHFWEEPGEYRFAIEPSGEMVRVRILQFDETFSDRPDDEGEAMLDATCELREFARAVLYAAGRVLQEHGLNGYETQWGRYSFPSDTLNDLRNSLDMRTP